MCWKEKSCDLSLAMTRLRGKSVRRCLRRTPGQGGRHPPPPPPLSPGAGGAVFLSCLGRKRAEKRGVRAERRRGSARVRVPAGRPPEAQPSAYGAGEGAREAVAGDSLGRPRRHLARGEGSTPRPSLPCA